MYIFDDSIIKLGLSLIDKLIPDKEKAAAAQLELLKLQQAGQLETLRTSMSAILQEAASQDPWTSRARPTFLYVIYIIILLSIPMGVLSIFSPEIAGAISNGFCAWLTAIPRPLYELFSVGYLGYAGARSLDKFHFRRHKP